MEGASPRGPVRLDAIRAQLRQMGYLQGPFSRIEGWMLAGRGGPSGFLRINAMASLRVALIGGPLIGVPAALAIALANRPHIGSARDLILLALYLSVALGAALGVLEFLTDTALAWLGRRGLVLVGQAEKLAARVGLLFFVATTLYLAGLARGGRAALLLSGGAGPGEGLIAWLAWAAAVLGALAVGHVIGRITRIGSLAALVAAGGGAGLAGRLAAPARRRPLLAAGLAALLLAAGWVVLGPTSIQDRSGRGHAAVAPAPFAGRIVLIGADGLEAGWYDRMKSQGVCPNLARLESEGARYGLETPDARVPPAVWTTVATGRPPSQHGILGYQAEHVPGLTSPVQDNPESAALTFSLRLLIPALRPAPSPVSSGMRRALAVWEILSAGGLATAAVNWWATWPADAAGGMVVSERIFVRLAARQQPDRDAWPEGLENDLASRFAADLDHVHSDLARLGVGAISGLALTSAVIDGYHAEVARRLVDSGLARVAFVYLPGLDIARARKSPAAPDHPDLAAILSNLDARVGEFTSMARPEDLLLVLGHPGRAGHEPGEEPSTGLLLAWGGRVAPGRRPRTIALVDIAPTVLALAGFPMARDLPGAPVVDFLKVGDVATRLPPSIDSYGTRPESLPAGPADPFDREVLDRLRSLGYIQ